MLETYTQYDLKILENSPFCISKSKFHKVFIQKERIYLTAYFMATHL